MAAPEKFKAELDYQEAYDSLIRSIRAILGIRRARVDWYIRNGQGYRIGPKWTRQVTLKLSAAHAIAELSGCWPPDAIIDPTELKKLTAEFELLVEGSSKP